MPPAVRKAMLTAHVTFSVGWTGAVAGFLALSIAGVSSANADVARGAYLAMNIVGLYVIVPIGILSLISGVAESVFTEWGLFRYNWVAAKFILTVFATALLLAHQFTMVTRAADLALRAAAGSFPAVGGSGADLVTKAGLAALLLIAITALSIYKPWGLTPYGRRIQEQQHKGLQKVERKMPTGLMIALSVLGAFIIIVALMHLSGHMTHGH